MNSVPHHHLRMRLRLRSIFALMALLLVAITADPSRLQGNDERGGVSLTGDEEPRWLRVLSYNIHHGEGIDGKLDLERIANVIRSVSPDVVALQEVDRRVERSESVDQAAELARLTDMQYVFGKNIDLQGGGYGNAVLSKHPIIRSENHHLPLLDDGEQRGVLEVQIRLRGEESPITLLATHLDHRSDPQERIASAKQINALVQDVEGPIALLAGDLNATPDSEPLALLSQHWRTSSLAEKKTIPVAEPTRQIDYILYRPGDPLVPVETLVLDEAVASDHRAVLATFALQRFSTATDQPLKRIVFGSCIRQDQPTPIFRTMIEADPDLLLMLGDNIYADTSDMAVMRSKYDRLAANRDFAALRTLGPTLATWDDHDYGINDAGDDYPQRDSSEQIFLDFWNDPLDAPRRSRTGVYTSSMHGPAGRRAQLILLDTRYFRSPLKTGERRTGGPYLADPDPDKTMLGEAQWQWLADQLRIPADLRIVASSIQCIASAAGQETWSNLPHERERLFQCLRDAEAEGVVIVSGDRHWAELSVEPEALGYPLYDMTSSSLNQKHGRGTPTDNAYRALPQTFHEENFGVIEVDWDADRPSVSLRVIDVAGEPQIEQTIPLETLRNPDESSDSES
jgi:alkaline phosphatase D